MTLVIPLVCEDVQGMTQEEYLEVLTGVFVDYFRDALTEDRLYYRFGEGVVMDTLLEEWLEMSGKVALYDATEDAIEEFMGNRPQDRLYPFLSTREKFGFTPGVIQDTDLGDYDQGFTSVSHFPRKNNRGLDSVITPCFSVTLSVEHFRATGDDVAGVVQDFLDMLNDASGTLLPEKVDAWSEAGYPVRLFTVPEGQTVPPSDSPNLAPSQDGQVAVYFIDNPDTEDEDDEGR